MRPGRYAAADGSFGRSAGAAMGRGVLLLAIALVIGIVLLNATDDQPPGADLVSGRGGDGDGDVAVTTTTAAPTTTAPPARNPAEVKVLVANASDVRGAAGRATDQLKAGSYNALAPGNAADAATSAVYFTAGYEREAAAIAAALELPAAAVKPLPTPPPADPKTANVLVVLGADHASRFGEGAAAGSGATTTTAAKETTTTASTGD